MNQDDVKAYQENVQNITLRLKELKENVIITTSNSCSSEYPIFLLLF